MKLYAIPRHDAPGKPYDGADKCGTTGVMSGEYMSVRNFIIYNVSKNAQQGVTYSIRRHCGWKGWPLLATYTKGKALA